MILQESWNILSGTVFVCQKLEDIAKHVIILPKHKSIRQKLDESAPTQKKNLITFAKTWIILQKSLTTLCRT